MSLYALGEDAPRLPDGPHYIAPGAALIGDVTIAPDVSIWFNAVLRGDNEPITIGRGSNIQDGAVCHTDPGFPLVVGADVTVGHLAILHGCTVGDGCLIGMGAVVMNGARVGRGCLIGAKALVPEGREIPDGAMVLGSPGKVVRVLDAEAQAGLLRAAEAYREKLARYSAGLRPAGG
ncbi:gamma carbonic anhydrase family protein [Paralimibaculum aggregatum]|uniref:Gamma carbonic anhydrase family protein n=1 Tax=Paralimibaculum aggregatum TaxID=3036245 RepID=A0ABQ6LLM1_9RHOB|nr:gamma carbonic anhydrase family protein [Limibaculum sp. NKW23]GMG81321.1 gamma carbonic anhydrase family protein [Limibaculum sp. NKW23]